MSPRELAARALGTDSGTVVSVEEIKHGLTNASWLVRTALDAVVVRISSRHESSLQIDRGAESIVLDTAAAAGIGPPIVACDLARGVLITRYLGATCTAAQMRAPEYIERLGRSFQALHALQPPRDVREIHLPTVVAGYLETLRTLASESVFTEPALRARGLALATEIAESSSPRLCHNDVHSLNVVDGNPLTLLDWEYAGIGEPFFDLASVCVYHEYTLEQRERLLRAYLEVPSTGDAGRLAKCCWLFDYVRNLWTAVRAAVETR